MGATDWVRPYPHQVLLDKKLRQAALTPGARLMINMPPQHGKALSCDTPVPTPHGWAAIGALRVGDYVFAPDGSPTRVAAVSPIWRDRELWRVTADDGSSVIADAEHEWRVRLDRKRPVWKTHSTRALAARTSARKPMIQPGGALQTPLRELPIPPYTLGAWLGDGTSSSGSICAEPEDEQNFFRAQFALDGFETRMHADGKLIGVLGLQARLRALGILHTPDAPLRPAARKYIPPVYLRASAEQRRALLQGLMDTDGYVAPDGQCEYCSVSPQLAADVRELVCSLGVKASLIEGRATLDGRDCGPKYRVMFYMADAARMPRKAARCRNAESKSGRYLSFEAAGRGDTVCIEVEHPSHMFLCGTGMLPTCNSTLSSLFFPIWLLANWPDKLILLASYESDFAESWGRKAREIIEDNYDLLGIRISANSRAVGRWELEGETTSKHGGMTCTGVGGALTGRGANLAIIDDPVKNDEQARSAVYREKAWQWYGTTFRTRLQKGASIIVISTRWHEDDLSGRLLEMAKRGGDQWDVINLPALAEEHDVLGRSPGEPLCPELHPLDELLVTRNTSTPYQWAALYQQRPAPEGGGLFKNEWLQHRYTTLPATGRRFATVDPAFSLKTTADYTAMGAWLYEPGTKKLYLIDMIRRRIEGPDLIPTLREFATRHSLREWWVEKTAAQLNIIQELTRQGFPVRELKADADKTSRAHAATPWFMQGRVLLPESAPWLRDYLDEMLAFTPNQSHKHDDMVDVSTYACGVAFEKPVSFFYAKPREATETLR